jgi:hypothetical protein
MRADDVIIRIYEYVKAPGSSSSTCSPPSEVKEVKEVKDGSSQGINHSKLVVVVIANDANG